MTKQELDMKLVKVCESGYPDINKIQELILAGADTNQVHSSGRNIFDRVFLRFLNTRRQTPKRNYYKAKKIKETIQLMVEHGWDVKRFGMSVMNRFLFSTYDIWTFDLYRFMLRYDLAENPEDYDEALEGIATEESYQRCCEENHETENLFYALYELVEAKKDGRNFESIEPYYGAVGMKIDRILYFDESDTTVQKEPFTEYNADIGFVCGDKVLILRKGVHILFMNDRLIETPQVDLSETFCADVIGQTIRSVSFDHKTVVKGTTHYGQPTINIELSNGKKLKFSHNFGELPDRESQSRFWIE